MSPRTTVFSALALTAALTLTACSTGEECAGAPTIVDAPIPTGDNLDTKPEIKVPDGEPPAELKVADIKEGDGKTGCTGDLLTVKYVGVTYSTGKQFDASWDNGQDFPFQIGQGAVIEGWDKGLLGMRVGGRRELVIPPGQAYGDQEQGADIPAGSTLVFVVDLVDVTDQPAPQ